MPRLRAAALLWLALALRAAAAETVFPPGSRLGLTPPKDMAPSARFTGFESPANSAAITFVEMPPEAYATLSRELTAAGLRTQGFALHKRETVRTASGEAILFTGEQAGLPVRKWLLVASDPSLTAFVIAQAVRPDAGASYTDEEMRTVLTSVAVRPPLTIEDQIAALPFRLGERAGFRPVRTLAGNALLLTDGPRDTIATAEQPILIVARSADAGPGQSPDKRDAFARGALVSVEMARDLVLERAQSFRQGGADWHEIVARGLNPASREPIVVMQTIRFAPAGYVRAVGIVRAQDRTALLPRFRAVIDSVTVDDTRY